MATFSCDNAPMNNPVIVCENLTVNYWLTDPEPPPSAGQSGAVDNAQNPTKPTEKPKASAKKGTGKGASAKANKNGQGNGQNKPKGKSKGARKRERKRERNRVKWQKQYQDVVARQSESFELWVKRVILILMGCLIRCARVWARSGYTAESGRGGPRSGTALPASGSAFR